MLTWMEGAGDDGAQRAHQEPVHACNPIGTEATGSIRVNATATVTKRDFAYSAASQNATVMSVLPLLCTCCVHKTQRTHEMKPMPGQQVRSNSASSIVQRLSQPYREELEGHEEGEVERGESRVGKHQAHEHFFQQQQRHCTHRNTHDERVGDCVDGAQ